MLWVLTIRNQYNDKQVPFFFKQWGGLNKAGRILEGRTWDEMPALIDSKYRIPRKIINTDLSACVPEY